MLVEPSPTPTSGALHAQQRVGWQPSRFLTDRAEAEHTFRLAERLGSVNAAQELGTTWPSLRKAFTRYGFGMPACNPLAVRQRAIAAVRQRTGQPGDPQPGSGVCGPQPWCPPRPPTVGGRAVPVGPPRGAIRHPGAPTWSSCTAKATPANPPLAPGQSSDEPTAPTVWPANAPAAPTAQAGPSNPRTGRWRPMLADPTHPTSRTASSDSTPAVLLDVTWIMP